MPAFIKLLCAACLHIQLTTEFNIKNAPMTHAYIVNSAKSGNNAKSYR